MASPGSAVRRPRHHRRHPGDERQRAVAPSVRHASRSRHRRGARHDRWRPRQGRRPRRQERGRLRPVEAGRRIVWQPGRHRQRDVQARPVAGCVEDAGDRSVGLRRARANRRRDDGESTRAARVRDPRAGRRRGGARSADARRAATAAPSIAAASLRVGGGRVRCADRTGVRTRAPDGLRDRDASRRRGT